MRGPSLKQKFDGIRDVLDLVGLLQRQGCTENQGRRPARSRPVWSSFRRVRGSIVAQLDPVATVMRASAPLRDACSLLAATSAFCAAPGSRARTMASTRWRSSPSRWCVRCGPACEQARWPRTPASPSTSSKLNGPAFQVAQHDPILRLVPIARMPHRLAASRALLAGSCKTGIHASNDQLALKLAKDT